jgi:hypothetical protein
MAQIVRHRVPEAAPSVPAGDPHSSDDAATTQHRDPRFDPLQGEDAPKGPRGLEMRVNAAEARGDGAQCDHDVHAWAGAPCMPVGLDPVCPACGRDMRRESTLRWLCRGICR